VNAGTEYAVVISSVGDDTTSKVMGPQLHRERLRFRTAWILHDSGTTWTMTTQDIAFKEGGWL